MARASSPIIIRGTWAIFRSPGIHSHHLPPLFFRTLQDFYAIFSGRFLWRWCFKLFCCFVTARSGAQRSAGVVTHALKDFFKIYFCRHCRPKNWGKNRSHLTVWLEDVSIINWRGRLHLHWDTNEWSDLWDVSVSIPDVMGEIFSPTTWEISIGPVKTLTPISYLWPPWGL